ncbi:MAG: T9SS type A sorting domain-containing protein [Bacteroidetes bacterium]|nr:T9SS type A sorting domain-containing protein [Bacteroidota bacterium]
MNQLYKITLLMVCFFAIKNIQAQTTIFVNHNATGTNDGTSWANAFANLQDAIAISASGDEIWVAAGTYYPDEGTAQTDNDRNATFQLKNNVGIYGGFAGTETNLAERDWVANVTILSGDINQSGALTGNAYSVVTGSGTDNTAIIDGFTITAGNADATTGSFTSPNRSGGGMYNNAGSPTVTNITFLGNFANDFGGGMLNSGGSPSILNNTFTGNSANEFGGGMANLNNVSADIINCRFSGNTAQLGGGMGNSGGAPLNIINCSFSGNTARAISDGDVALGGGMYNAFSSPTITNSTFSGNRAGFGGGISNSSSSPTVTNCTFSGNMAIGDGGGMFNTDFSSPTITNNIIWNNAARSSMTSISAASISNNRSSSVTISYSLVANSGGSGSWVSAIGTDGTNNIDIDPLFIDPQAPGLSTLGDYRLQVGSPAIDAGLNSANTSTSDLDGNPRIDNGTIDMGAYENQLVCPTGIVLYVASSASGTNDGTSWADAFDNLQDALNSPCVVVAEIWVASGTYYPDEGTAQTDNDRNATFQLKNDVALYGGFAGTETNLAERDWVANVTILSGDINQSGDLTGNSYTVVTGSDVNNTAIIDGFAITAGNADDINGSVTNPNRSGGGMYNNAGSPTVSNNTFLGNSANRGGGMLNSNGGSPTISNTTFLGNSVSSFGGGMVNINNASSTIINSSFSGNTAIFGGGMSNIDSSPTITNSTISGNIASTTGGGIYNEGFSTLTITNSIIWNNAANGSTTSSAASVFNTTSSTSTISYSLVANSGGSGSWVIAIGSDGGNNIDADPFFFDPQAPGLSTLGDYRLQAGSLAIDAGLNSANTLATDLDGNPRVVNGTIDMGAFENTATLSLEDFSTENGFRLFPNPVQNLLNISINNGLLIEAYEIYNINGQAVGKGTNLPQEGIDVSNLASGLYILKLQTDKGTRSEKFIKM